MKEPVKLSPILMFSFNRLDTLKKTVGSLQANLLARESELFIFSDAARTEQERPIVEEVRKFLRTIRGFKDITIYEANYNKGLAQSIVEGVSNIINRDSKVIVLEDDLVTSPNFLVYMNKALDFYEQSKHIYSISGFTMPIKITGDSDVYFTRRASSWGWATWKDRWQQVDWSVKDYDTFKKDKKAIARFNRMGSDMSYMLKRSINGNIDSWAIKWCYYQFKHDLYTVFPAVSKIINIGLETQDATHTNERFNRFKTVLDKGDTTTFFFDSKPKLDSKIIRQFTVHYSIPTRLKYKLLNLIFAKR